MSTTVEADMASLPRIASSADDTTVPFTETDFIDDYWLNIGTAFTRAALGHLHQCAGHFMWLN